MRILLLVSLLLGGCAYRVRIESRPPGATVLLPNGETIGTPDEARLRWVPFGEQQVQVSAPGYRTLEADLREYEITFKNLVVDRLLRPWRAFDGRADNRVEFVLIPEHGGAGTWTPEGQDIAR